VKSAFRQGKLLLNVQALCRCKACAVQQSVVSTGIQQLARRRDLSRETRSKGVAFSRVEHHGKLDRQVAVRIRRISKGKGS
jgi:hypothetical protein